MTDWRLGIDFGTSYTVTAVWRNGSATTVDIESNGSSRIPSSVYLTEEGKILVGSFAVQQSVFGPERFEPTPKRAIGEGEIFLGDRTVPVAELAAAVFRKVYEVSCREQGGTTPSAVRITHPADWGATRLGVLTEALALASIPNPILIKEPVAAAALIATETPPGRHVAVYDFGGGTFDAAVLRRTAAGTFEVAGPPAGRDPLGGEDIDQRIITYIGTIVGETNEAWLNLINPSDTKSRQDAVTFRTHVQHAKETLSEVSACQLWIPGLERDLQLTRSELEELILPDIEATVDTLETALSDASVAASDLAGVFLTGGSSRIPLVAQTIRKRLGVLPGVQGNPKSVVALGAATWIDASAAPPGPPPPPPPPPRTPATQLVGPETDALGRTLFRAHLAADVSGSFWPAGSVGLWQVALERTDGVAATIRARDEPTTVTASIKLADQVNAFRAARTPGYREVSRGGAWLFGRPGGVERRFTMVAGGAEILMVERYLVLDGRAFVLASPATAMDVADGFVLTESQEPGLYRSRFEFWCPPRWSASEQLTVRRNGSIHSLIGEHTRFPQAVRPLDWLNGCMSRLQSRLERPAEVGRTGSRVLSGLDGLIVSLRSTNRGSPVLTKLGVAVSGPDAFAITISLPHREQNQFASLARQLCLNPAVVAPPITVGGS
jgi:molecular chaperone DnaK